MRARLGRAGAVVLGLLGITSGVALTPACAPAKTATTLSANEAWCPDRFEVGPQDTCFAVPELTTKETPVLVYLHGEYVGHGSADEWNLVHSAIDRGFAVVMPRGRRGLCAWKAELKDHFCWPQEVDDPQAFKAMVADWDRVLWQVDAIMEGGPHKRYVLGFSNGGFFANYLAQNGLFPARAYAIVNGGPLGPATKPAQPVPVMLLAAEQDAVQGAKMKELHDGLARVGWTHAYCMRPGNHPLASQDVDAALKFFKRDAEGSLKVSGAGVPGYACEAGTNAAPGVGGGGAGGGAGGNLESLLTPASGPASATARTKK